MPLEKPINSDSKGKESCKILEIEERESASAIAGLFGDNSNKNGKKRHGENGAHSKTNDILQRLQFGSEA